MAEVANAGHVAYDSCIHRVRISSTVRRITRFGDIEDWLFDPSRPGYWHWLIEALGDGRSADYLFLSDPDVAFEAKMRWG